MRVLRLKLGNIRSYSSLDVSFNEGSTLLGGDIGCGKTSLLLAIEFALFGIIKGSTSGSTLLRHGAREGFVELTVVLNNSPVTIRRSLKRTKTSVSQGPGFIEADGSREDCTAVELKARVLDLLGYPTDLLTKGKNLIFRYTVYTPQEEMRSILYESKEERLDTLRKLFNIDKYKRVRENALFFVKNLKVEVAELTGRIHGLKDDELLLSEFGSKLESAKKDYLLAVAEVDISKKKVSELSERLSSLESIDRERNKVNLDLISLKSSVGLSTSNLSRLSDDLVSSQKQLGELPEVKEGEDVSARRDELESKLKLVSEKRLQLTRKQTELQTKKNAQEETVSNISSLDDCPLCKQPVTHDHKHSISEQASVVVEKINLNLSTINQAFSTLDEKERVFNEEKLVVRKQLEAQAAFSLARRQRLVLQERISSIKEKIVLEEKTLEENKSKVLVLEKQLVGLPSNENEVKELKLEVDRSSVLLREKEVLSATLKEKLYSFEREKLELQKRVDEMKLSQDKLSSLQEKIHWLQEFFITSVGLIEKQVLNSVHYEFESYFKEWFSILMESEDISASLDDYFTPSLLQNGYDTSVENLSGGEKTAVALAYRLALNKVVNDFMHLIQTKNLLILDEPTDGFSSEQLDKMRDVLDKLNLPQVILVSHEQKLESYAQNVIRIQKQDHESVVA